MTKAATPAKRRDAERAEIEARERALYGDLVADVRFLRGRSFVITAAAACTFVVGTRAVDGPGLRAIADRERRLAGRQIERLTARQVKRSASGLKVGQVEAYPTPRRARLRQQQSTNQQ